MSHSQQKSIQIISIIYFPKKKKKNSVFGEGIPLDAKPHIYSCSLASRDKETDSIQTLVIIFTEKGGVKSSQERTVKGSNPQSKLG
jgi:hypothetical protein